MVAVSTPGLSTGSSIDHRLKELDIRSPIDPAAGSHLITKVGIDATRKPDYPDQIMVPGADDIDLADYIEGYKGG